MLFERVPNIDKAVLSVHCHNDLGLAVANSLAAVHAGARQIECTINGLGERAGNAAMEEIVMALRTRNDYMPYTTGIRTENIMRASRLVSTVTGFTVQPNKAIVGANAFAHEAGIHQDGVLKHAGTYEIMTPESVGLTASTLVLGKHSGSHAFREKLKELGYDLGDNAARDAFKRFKDLADKKKEIFDEDIVALVDDEVVRANDHVRLISLEILCGTKHRPPKAELELEIDGEVKQCRATGDGPVDAAFNGIKALFPHEAAPPALSGARGDPRHGCPGRGHRPPGGERQDRHRPGRGHRHHGRVRQGLCERSQQASGEEKEIGAGGAFSIVFTTPRADTFL